MTITNQSRGEDYVKGDNGRGDESEGKVDEEC